MGLKENLILYIFIVRHTNASGIRYICAIAQEAIIDGIIDVGRPASVQKIDFPIPCIF